MKNKNGQNHFDVIKLDPVILGWENGVDQSLLKRMRQTTPVKKPVYGFCLDIPGRRG